MKTHRIFFSGVRNIITLKRRWDLNKISRSSRERLEDVLDHGRIIGNQGFIVGRGWISLQIDFECEIK